MRLHRLRLGTSFHPESVRHKLRFKAAGVAALAFKPEISRLNRLLLWPQTRGFNHVTSRSRAGVFGSEMVLAAPGPLAALRLHSGTLKRFIHRAGGRLCQLVVPACGLLAGHVLG